MRQITDAAQAISYVCKYLSKRRERCLKGARLWSAFGKIERTRVKDVLVDPPKVRLLRRIMGKPSVQDELNGIQSGKLPHARSGGANLELSNRQWVRITSIVGEERASL